MPRTLCLGLGNDILTDDAIGLRLARRLQTECVAWPETDVRETTEMGLALLDHIAGYDRVWIIDAIQTGRAAPGFLHDLDATSLKRLTGGSPHFLGVGETLALGRELGLPMPREVRILAVEIQDPFTLGTEMTPALEAALPGLVEQITCLLAKSDWEWRQSIPDRQSPTPPDPRPAWSVGGWPKDGRP